MQPQEKGETDRSIELGRQAVGTEMLDKDVTKGKNSNPTRLVEERSGEEKRQLKSG